MGGFFLFFLFWSCPDFVGAERVVGSGTETLNMFIEDIIKSWKLLSPTIIFTGEMIDWCRGHDLILCVTNDENVTDLAEHLATIHKVRKQDGLIFVDYLGHETLLGEAVRIIPSMFTSKCPVFMPKVYSSMIELRLDSNVIFYEELTESEFTLVDIFAVKGGPKITVELGLWIFHRGFMMINSLNRWDRRLDLMGTIFVNGLQRRKLIKENETIIGVNGHYQGQLSYMTDRLNLTVKVVETPNERGRPLQNGSWTGSIGMLQRNEIDVESTGTGISLERYPAIDFPSPAYRVAKVLFGKKPTGSAPNTFVYMQVFGVRQWLIVVAFLILLVISTSSIHALSREGAVRAYGIKRGNKAQYELNSLASSIAFVCLYTIQMGSHTNTKQMATRLLTLTLSMLTFLVWVHYTTDITAEITFEAPKIPVRNFEDAVHHGYKVVVSSPFLRDSLGAEEPGSAKHLIYKTYLEHGEVLDKPEVAFQKIATEGDTLYYNCKCALARAKQYHLDQVVALSLDDSSYAYASFALNLGSEFLPLFNYYLLKALEHGIERRDFKSTHTKLFTNEEFGMPEPEPLGFKNTMFVFILLGFGVCASVLIALAEFLVQRRIQENELAPGTSRQTRSQTTTRIQM